MTTTTGDNTARRAEARRFRTEEGLSKRQIADRFGVSTGLLTTWLSGTDAPEWTRRPNAKDDLRDAARTLRREHHSVPEIAAELGIAKSTAYQWVRDIPLDAEARRAIFAREHSSTTEHSRMMREARNAKRDCRRTEVATAAAEAVPALSDAELLRAGALIYWCEGTKDKPWRQSGDVQFVNSDPGLITLFLRFLRAAGVPAEDIAYRVMIHETADERAAVAWWAQLVGTAPESFSRTTIKRHNPKTVRRNTGEAYRGCLVIRVRKSRELYWRIEAIVQATIRSGEPMQ